MRDLDIRQATEAELGSCRALLPEIFPAMGRAPGCLVCMKDGKIAAVGAMGWFPGGFPVQAHVVPGFRRQGIGRAILAALAAEATGETAMLRSLISLTDASEATLFLRSCGFVETQRLQVFECDPARLGAAMSKLLARLGERVPPNAVLVPPGDADATEVAALLAQSFAVGHEDLSARLSGEGVNAWASELSRVLLVGGVVAGVILARQVGQALEVDFNIVAPAWRGGWANLLLVEAVLRNGRAAGLPQLRFLAEAQVRDTVNLARRAGAERGPDRLSMMLALDGSALRRA